MTSDFSNVAGHIRRKTITVLLATIFLSISYPSLAAITVDGRLNEPEWTNAQVFRDFMVTNPLILESPRLDTEARLVSTPDGLAVAFICQQPPEETRTRTVTTRDAMSFDSDSVAFLVDFDGTGDIGYEFSVSITGAYRDGAITTESTFKYDWDGLWQRAVHEEENLWSVEILLPWSIVTMRESIGDTRRIGVLFQRTFFSDSQTYSCPAISKTWARFLSEFTQIDVEKYTAAEFDVWPYVTILSDLKNDNFTSKAGVDLFWKASGRFQFAATVNPDFGQVESDELVIDFSAIETFFSDKRAFFTENQSIFEYTLPQSNKFVYTRRIGGPGDNGSSSSDIDIAAKAIGSAGPVNYGVLAARESDNAGRTFYAGRFTLPKENMTLGLFSTFVDRPFLDRTGLVNVLTYDFILNDTWRFEGEVLNSRVDVEGEQTSGLGWSSAFKYTPVPEQQYTLVLFSYDEDLDYNDMGYMRRNDLQEIYFGTVIQQGFSEESKLATIQWTARTHIRQNTDHERLISDAGLWADSWFRNGSHIGTNLLYEFDGNDDLISRGNGLVYLKGRLSGNIHYMTPKRGGWGKFFSFDFFQEGIEDWGAGVTARATWYPRENLTIGFQLNPSWSRDWLIWLQDDQFGSFSRNSIRSEISTSWFPFDKHEIRLRTQWYTIKADAEQSFRIDADRHLVPSHEDIDSFAVMNFGLQLRYRFEIAPLSDFYVVYSRGGIDRIENPDDNTFDLLIDSTGIRNSDQIIAKLRYRF